MIDKTKVIYLDTAFIKQVSKSEDDGVESVMIEGYASTNDIDRSGDVVSASVWEKGLTEYLKNPIILAYHDYKQPCGRMVDHRMDSKGLWIKARISPAAEEVYKLVKDEVMTAFSIGFKILDAEYNQAAEVFLIKEIQLHEISVVPVPANQNTLFSLSKAFETAEDYAVYKKLFSTTSSQAKELDHSNKQSSNINKEWNMTPEEIQARIDEAAAKAAKQAVEQMNAARQQADAEVKAKALAEVELEARVKAAVAAVTPSTTGAEKLMAEVEKRIQDQSKSIDDLMASLKEKSAEIEAMQKSKMSFSDKGASELAYADKEKAILLAKMSGKSLAETKFGKQLIEKAGAHVPSATWELEVSLNMENEVRRRLVVAPTLRSIAMQTNVMTIPINPEAGTAQWMANTAFGTTTSAGNTAVHQLKEITLNSYKVATNEYLAYEEEEDALLAIMPVIRDGMIRRVARSVDRAMLRGAGAGNDPVKGLTTYDETSAVNLDLSDATKLTALILRSMRRDIGAWGLDPSELVYIVNTDGYYDLLEDENFQTMDKVGAKATLLTGQIGSIGNTPVLVSAEFADKAAGVAAAVCFAPGNFLVGNQRGLRIDTQDLVETQRKVMVASLRTGLTQVTTNLGGAVSTLRYVA